MPAPRVLDLSVDRPEGTGIESAFSGLMDSYKEREDQSTFNRIMQDYQKNQGQRGASGVSLSGCI